MNLMKTSVLPPRIVRCVPWLLAAAVLMPFVTRGAAFIKFEDIEGEAQTVAYQGWSKLEAVSQAITREIDPESGSIRMGGDANFEEFLCEKILDKSSPKLAEAIATGKVFSTVEIHLTRNNEGPGGQAPYLVYELKNVVITSYSIRGHSSALTQDYEAIGLRFSEITMRYHVLDIDGESQGVVEYNFNLDTQSN